MKTVKNILTFLLLTCIPIVTIELLSCAVIKSLYPASDPDSMYPHLFDPYRGHALNPDYHYSYYAQFPHTRAGFRGDTPVSKKKDAGMVRIIMLGASALYGIETGGVYPFYPMLKNTETITHYLEEKLQNSFSRDGLPYKAEVINAGVTGYHTFQHLVYVNALLLEYEPDWVINLDGHNDFYYGSPRRNHWMDYPYSSVVFTDLVNTRDLFVGVHLVVRALAPYSYTFNILERQTKKILQNKTAVRIKKQDTGSSAKKHGRAIRQSPRRFLQTTASGPIRVSCGHCGRLTGWESLHTISTVCSCSLKLSSKRILI